MSTIKTPDEFDGDDDVAVDCLDLVGAIMDGVKVRMASALKADGLALQLMEAHILRIVLRRGVCTQNEIVRETRRDKAQIAKLVQMLERRHLLLRRPDPADARRVQITLTDDGEAIAALCVVRREAIARQLVVDLAPHDRHRLRTLLRAAEKGLSSGMD